MEKIKPELLILFPHTTWTRLSTAGCLAGWSCCWGTSISDHTPQHKLYFKDAHMQLSSPQKNPAKPKHQEKNHES